MEKIKINVSKPYEVLVENGLFSRAGEIIFGLKKGGKVMIVTDINVGKLYANKLKNQLNSIGFSAQIFTTNGGEQSKSTTEFAKLLETLAENEFTRTDTVVALGGGIVGDLSGFVSACYLRGIDYVQIPTSLLAMVDSSVGGKTAVNLTAGKNLAGAFYQPICVLVDPELLSTLPKKEYSCGMAEVIKYGAVFSNSLFKILENGERAVLEKVIADCIKHKKSVVEIDEFDNGCRQKLNFGHTIGHAIEKLTDYKLTHGQAVALGMLFITDRAVKKGYCSEEAQLRLNKVIKNNGLLLQQNFDINSLLKYTFNDKKRKGDFITVVIVKEIGESITEKMSIEKWQEFWKD